MTLTTIPTHGDTSWFVQDRFGLFIHWGLYSMPARREWVKKYEKIPDEVYDKYFRHFDPDLYDPDLWAKTASNAGMKYFVVTTKHHEGFCLWDTKLTDYKATNTPYGKDLLHPMVDAFRGYGMKVGFYHSLVDWHHPQFVIDKYHPLSESPDRDRLNESRDQNKYIEYLHGQVRELLTEFGNIDVMWFDFSYPVEGDIEGKQGKGRMHWQSEKLLKVVRELQPRIVLDDRLDLEDGWDIKTPEQVQPREWLTYKGRPVVWEACHTFSDLSWGYNRDEMSWKSVEMLIQMLIDTVSKGGNFLLNVGPTGRGEFDERALDRLNGIGEWMKRHSRAIYGCTQAPEEYKTPQDCRLTYNPEKNRIYVHMFSWPFQCLYLDGFAGKVEYAQFLNDASEVRMEEKPQGTLLLVLPTRKPDVTVPVIELFMK